MKHNIGRISIRGNTPTLTLVYQVPIRFIITHKIVRINNM